MVAKQREEDIFRDEIVGRLNGIFSTRGTYKAVPKANLWYRLQLKDDGTRDPSDEQPMRGRNAFQQDIVLFEKKTGSPRLVIETKVKGCSTDQAIAYSTRAHLLKQVYPFLRYILLIGNAGNFTYKLIKHGEFFDAIKTIRFDPSSKIVEKDFESFLELLEREIEISQKLGEIIREELDVEMFWKPIEFSLVVRRS